MAWQVFIRTTIYPVNSRLKLNGSLLYSLGCDTTDVRDTIWYDLKSLKCVR